MTDAHITLQEYYKNKSRYYFNALFGNNRELFDGILDKYPISQADAALACRVVTPVYPIIINRMLFEQFINQSAVNIIGQIAGLGNKIAVPQTRKHIREYGQRETTDDDLVTSTDDATTDTSTDNAYFDPSPRYDVEPMRQSQSDIGQRKRTDDIDRKHTEKAHTDVEYDELTDWDMVKQINEFRSRAIDLLIQWLSDTITASREWGVNGV